MKTLIEVLMGIGIIAQVSAMLPNLLDDAPSWMWYVIVLALMLGLVGQVAGLIYILVH